MIINLAFLLDSKPLLKFDIYTLLIHKYFPDYYRFPLIYENAEINLEDVISINFIIVLF